MLTYRAAGSETRLPGSALSYGTLLLVEDGAELFVAADVVAGVEAGPGAAWVGVSFAEAMWT
ncbi:hypothetical protein SRB17_19630 [Streptomyces sp. RB17]|uniref:hypothetical protein n=1 Tax=Streptomyces sp. RB17 TaxID=2585197 RepID=UPI001297D383|nr:hypothetical protein [Streptomyces sp. RB17]MQY33997.1 hypothetical protein [Streptomyces sp. RB17]